MDKEKEMLVKSLMDLETIIETAESGFNRAESCIMVISEQMDEENESSRITQQVEALYLAAERIHSDREKLTEVVNTIISICKGLKGDKV